MIEISKSYHTAIVQVENTINDKVFVDYTDNVNKYFNRISSKLNNQKFKNKLLQKDWDKQNESDFEISVLQYLNKEESENVNTYISHWIKKLESTDRIKGYNTKRELDGYSKSNEDKWLYDGDIVKHVKSYLEELDKDLLYSDERLNVIDGINQDADLIKYISSQGFVSKQLKTKGSFSAESDQVSKVLQELAYYILFPEFKNEVHQKEFILDETGSILNNYGANNVKEDKYVDGINEKIHGYTIISKSKYIKDKKRMLFLYDVARKVAKSNEIELINIVLDELLILADKEMKSIEKKKRRLKKKQSKPQRFVVKTRYEVNDDDLSRHNELKQINDYKNNIAKMIGIGLDEKQKEKLLGNFEKKFDEWKEKYPQLHFTFNGYVKFLTRIHSEVSSEMNYVKERLSQPITFKSIGKNSNVFDYDYSMFNFTDVNQVKVLLTDYRQLKDRHYHKRGDIWANLFVLEDLLNQINFDEYELFIIGELILGSSINDVINEFNNYYGFIESYSDRKIRRMVDEYIPKKIVDKYIELKDEFMFYKYRDLLKPNYKRCSTCEEYKLVLPRYFYKKNDSKDGFHNTCVKCMQKS